MIESEKVTGWWHTCVTDEVLGAFFDAANVLYAVQPWRQVPDHSCLIHMMVPAFGKRTWVVSVLGQDGVNNRGIMLFDNVHAFKRYEKISDAEEAGIKPTKIPSHDLLHFEDSGDVPESLRQAVAEKGWWAANKEAFPTVLQVDPYFRVAQVHLHDVVFFETFTRALAKALESPEPWYRAWQGGEPVEMTLSVDSSDGKQEVILGTELSQGFDLFNGSDDELLAAFAEMNLRNASIDFDQLERLERSLMSRVAASPEALELEDPILGLGMLLDLASQLLVPVTQLDVVELEQMLFDDIPHVVMLGGDSASAIVSSLQLAYQWMVARHPLEHGADCLNLLNDSIIERLETRLVDAQLFGPRKTQLISEFGTDFDTTTPEGFNKMMRTAFGGSSVAQSLVLEDPPPAMAPGGKPPNPSFTAKQKTKRKVNRKAARKARKKNR